MKRTILAGALVVLLAFSASATAAPADKLKSFQARSAAESAAFDFYIRRKLDNAKVGRCKRQSRRRIVCDARASGETKRLLKTCNLRIRVRAVWRGYWDEAAAIVGRRCQKVPKPLLTYPAALAAIQAEADRFAGKPTAITYMFRRDDVTFSSTATWMLTDPHGCKGCGYDSDTESFYDIATTQTCSVDLVATLADRAVTVANDGFSCF
jgi:hypothetical protein